MTWRTRRRLPHDAAVAAEYAGVKERLSVLAPMVLGFLVGTVAGAVAYAGLDLWCVLLAIAVAAGLAARTSLRGEGEQT
jgi:hypothetical protein